MRLPNRIWVYASAVIVLGGCKGSSSSGGATGAPNPSANDSGSAAPPATAPPTPAVLSTLLGFEGEIDMTAKGEDQNKPPQPVNMLIKADKLRLDVIPGTDAAKTLGGKAFLLLRPLDKKMDVVTEAKKQVVELDFANPEVMKGLTNLGSTPGHPTKPEPPPKITKTGTKETIAGYPCEDWEVASAKDNKKQASLCVAELPSTFFHIPLTTLPTQYNFALELIDGKHFPLRMVAYDEHTGTESGRIEVNKVDAHPVDASKFEIPAGYQTIDMMQMLGALSRAPGLPSGMPNMPNAPHGHHGKH